MFSPQSNYLVISLLSYLLSHYVLAVLLLSLPLISFNALLECVDFDAGRGHFLPEHVNLTAHLQVLRFCLVQLDPLVVHILARRVHLVICQLLL